MLALAGALSACQPQHDLQKQTEALTLAPNSLAQRQEQMRRFDTKDEGKMLQACAGVLQDLGFTLDESSTNAGFVVASKDRDAIESGQVAGQMFIWALITAFGGKYDPVWEKNQKIRISIITRKSTEAEGIVVRVTFQRVIWNTKNQISRVETLDDPVMYQEFFDKLSQSVFLAAHDI